MGARARRSLSEAASARKASSEAGPTAAGKVPQAPHVGRRRGCVEADDRVAVLRAVYRAIACEPIPPGLLALLRPRRHAN